MVIDRRRSGFICLNVLYDLLFSPKHRYAFFCVVFLTISPCPDCEADRGTLEQSCGNGRR